MTHAVTLAPAPAVHHGSSQCEALIAPATERGPRSRCSRRARFTADFDGQPVLLCGQHAQQYERRWVIATTWGWAYGPPGAAQIEEGR